MRVRPSLSLAEQDRWKLVPEESTAQIHFPAGDGTSDGKAGARTFSFDGVCGPQCTQEAVYSHVKESVTIALGGGCGGVLCYGSAKSGKTHTLANLHIGEWGVIAQALSDIYVAALDRGVGVEVACALLHDETLVDLLADAPNGGTAGGTAAGGS